MTSEGDDSPRDDRNRGAREILKRDELNLPLRGSWVLLPAGGKEFPWLPGGRLQIGDRLHFGCCRAPGEGRGTATALLRPPAFGIRICRRLLRFKVSGAGLTDLETQAPEPCVVVAEDTESPLAGHRTASLLSVPLWEFRPIPVSRNFGAWDCKVTPAGSSCQEGNTIGCIPSNDGLGAGFGPGFPHCGKQRTVVICGMGILGLYVTAGAGVAVGLQRDRASGSTVPPGRVS